MKKETRIYPITCLSAFCGRETCQDCENKPILDDFKAWKKKTKAKQADPIWSRLLYVATRKEV